MSRPRKSVAQQFWEAFGPAPDFLDHPDAAGRPCLGTDEGVWFGSGTAAKALCEGCPLLDRCRAWALDQPAERLFGVWGGMGQNERALERTARRRLTAA